MRLHLVRYEDLILKPVETFGRLIEFLEFMPDRKRLEKGIIYDAEPSVSPYRHGNPAHTSQ